MCLFFPQLRWIFSPKIILKKAFYFAKSVNVVSEIIREIWFPWVWLLFSRFCMNGVGIRAQRKGCWPLPRDWNKENAQNRKFHSKLFWKQRCSCMTAWGLKGLLRCETDFWIPFESWNLFVEPQQSWWRSFRCNFLGFTSSGATVLFIFLDGFTPWKGSSRVEVLIWGHDSQNTDVGIYLNEF